MLEKMGWSQGKGLGAMEDGAKEQIKVWKKNDNLGIGATKKTVDNWLENTFAFSDLLQNLNERTEMSIQNDDNKDNKDNDNNDNNTTAAIIIQSSNNEEKKSDILRERLM